MDPTLKVDILEKENSGFQGGVQGPLGVPLPTPSRSIKDLTMNYKILLYQVYINKCGPFVTIKRYTVFLSPSPLALGQ